MFCKIDVAHVFLKPLSLLSMAQDPHVVITTRPGSDQPNSISNSYKPLISYQSPPSPHFAQSLLPVPSPASVAGVSPMDRPRTRKSKTARSTPTSSTPNTTSESRKFAMPQSLVSPDPSTLPLPHFLTPDYVPSGREPRLLRTQPLAHSTLSLTPQTTISNRISPSIPQHVPVIGRSAIACSGPTSPHESQPVLYLRHNGRPVRVPIVKSATIQTLASSPRVVSTSTCDGQLYLLRGGGPINLTIGSSPPQQTEMNRVAYNYSPMYMPVPPVLRASVSEPCGSEGNFDTTSPLFNHYAHDVATRPNYDGAVSVVAPRRSVGQPAPVDSSIVSALLVLTCV